MARVDHPNVVTVHDVGVFGGRMFIATEFVDGGDLRAWMDERPRDWREVVPVFVNVPIGVWAGALAANARAATRIVDWFIGVPVDGPRSVTLVGNDAGERRGRAKCSASESGRGPRSPTHLARRRRAR